MSPLKKMCPYSLYELNSCGEFKSTYYVFCWGCVGNSTLSEKAQWLFRNNLVHYHYLVILLVLCYYQVPVGNKQQQQQK